MSVNERIHPKPSRNHEAIRNRRNRGRRDAGPGQSALPGLIGRGGIGALCLLQATGHIVGIDALDRNFPGEAGGGDIEFDDAAVAVLESQPYAAVDEQLRRRRGVIEQTAAHAEKRKLGTGTLVGTFGRQPALSGRTDNRRRARLRGQNIESEPDQEN